jgi:hypothetical protein
MNKPTAKQVKIFWEWCGFKLNNTSPPDPIYSLNSPDGEQYNIWYAFRCGTNKRFDSAAVISIYPNITLNNLFKYAVPNPKIKTLMLGHYFRYDGENGMPERDGYEASIFWDTMENVCVARDKDPALALFWAIWQLVDRLAGEQ